MPCKNQALFILLHTKYVCHYLPWIQSKTLSFCSFNFICYLSQLAMMQDYCNRKHLQRTKRRLKSSFGITVNSLFNLALIPHDRNPRFQFLSCHNASAYWQTKRWFVLSYSLLVMCKTWQRHAPTVWKSRF